MKRVSNRVWVYRAASPYWWFLGFAAKNIAKEQLEFNNGFRPDIVVALDPFESGLAGLMVAHAYDRPFQVHISDDLFSKAFFGEHKRNSWRQRIARYVLKRTKSVRTTTDAQKEIIQKRFNRITDIALLPRFYNLNAIM